MLCHVFRDSGTSCSRFWLTLSSDGLACGPPSMRHRCASCGCLGHLLSVDDGEPTQRLADHRTAPAVGPGKGGEYDIQDGAARCSSCRSNSPRRRRRRGRGRAFNEEAHTSTRRDSFSRPSLFRLGIATAFLVGAPSRSRSRRTRSAGCGRSSSQHDPAYLARLDGVLGAPYDGGGGRVPFPPPPCAPCLCSCSCVLCSVSLSLVECFAFAHTPRTRRGSGREPPASLTLNAGSAT